MSPCCHSRERMSSVYQMWSSSWACGVCVWSCMCRLVMSSDSHTEPIPHGVPRSTWEMTIPIRPGLSSTTCQCKAASYGQIGCVCKQRHKHSQTCMPIHKKAGTCKHVGKQVNRHAYTNREAYRKVRTILTKSFVWIWHHRRKHKYALY